MEKLIFYLRIKFFFQLSYGYMKNLPWRLFDPCISRGSFFEPILFCKISTYTRVKLIQDSLPYSSLILILIVIFLKHPFPYLDKGKLLFTIVVVSCSLQDLKCLMYSTLFWPQEYSSWEMLMHTPIIINVI